MKTKGRGFGSEGNFREDHGQLEEFQDGKTAQLNQQCVVYINLTTTCSCKLAGRTNKAIPFTNFAASFFSL